MPGSAGGSSYRYQDSRRSPPALYRSGRFRLEGEGLDEKLAAALGIGRVGADAVEALQGVLDRDLRVPGHERRVVRLHDGELEIEPLRIGEAEAAVVAARLHGRGAEPLLPEVESLFARNPPDDAVDHPRPGPAAARVRVLEEGDVGAGASGLVRIEQVVDGRVVLVDRLLDEPQAEQPRVELDVAGRIAGDARDVVDAFQLHRGRTLPPRLLATMAENVFATIVCGVDGTPASVVAVQQAGALADRDSRLLLVSVVDEASAAAATAPGGGVVLPPPTVELENEALGEAAGKIRQERPELTVETRVLEGAVLPTLLQALDDERATVAVVGRHGHSRLAGLVLGSAMTKLLHDAPCAVLVAGATAEGDGDFPRSVVVGYDGSEQAAAAVRAASEVAHRSNASLDAVCATGGKEVDVETLQAEPHEARAGRLADRRGRRPGARPGLCRRRPRRRRQPRPPRHEGARLGQRARRPQGRGLGSRRALGDPTGRVPAAGASRSTGLRSRGRAQVAVGDRVHPRAPGHRTGR